jgi:hypothetical protein
MAKMTKEETIEACKGIAEKNYEKGYDAIVECWDESDWGVLYDACNGSFPKMKKAMKEDAGMWIEQNLNARWGEDDDDCLSMLD